MAKRGYYISSSADGTVQFRLGSPKQRVHGKLYSLLSQYVTEIPSKRLDQGSKIPSFLHEPDDELLGYQVMIELNKYVALKVPEIVLHSVFIDRSETNVESSTLYMTIIYDYANETIEDKFSLDLVQLGVT